MGREMTRQEIIDACTAVVEEMRMQYVPNPKTRYKKGGSSGNMAANGLQYVLEDNEFVVYIDEVIAWYVWFTQKPWTAERWRGKKNPNEGWFEVFQEEFARRLARRLGGRIER